MKIKNYLVKLGGDRVDKFLARKLSNYSRSFIQGLVKKRLVKLNGNFCNCSNIVKENDCIVVSLPNNQDNILEGEEFKLDILFEDDYVLLINKPVSLVVHPDKSHMCGTLVNQLLGYNAKVFEQMIDEEKRPGIVHRLDRDTTGVMIIAKTPVIKEQLQSAFRGRNIKKTYLALVKGELKNDSGIIKTRYGRNPKHYAKMAVLEKGHKEAITGYRTLARHNGVSLVQVRLQTGRTHQIRVHLQYMNCPIIGDNLYGTKEVKNLAERQMLHAWRLAFYHPFTKEKMSLEAPVPQDIITCAAKYNIQID